MDVNGGNRYGLRYLNNELKSHDLPVYMEADSLMKVPTKERESLLDSFVNYTERSFSENALESKLDKDSYKMTMAVLNNLKMSIEFNRANPLTITKKRDQFMFENVSFLEKNFAPEGSSIFVWAHNGHIRKQGASFLFKPVGHFLHEEYGQQYMAIALDFMVGKAYALGEVTITPEDNSNKSFIGNYLKRDTGGIQFINLNQKVKFLNGKAMDWPSSFRLHNYTINKGMEKYAKDDFDALLVLDRVTSIYDYKNSVYDK